jgi:hypothetical protein
MQLALQSALYNSGIFSLQGTMAFIGITGDMLWPDSLILFVQ